MIGTRIRERRVRPGSAVGAGQTAGISPSYLNLIEHNRRRIGGKTLLKLAEALEVEPRCCRKGPRRRWSRRCARRPPGRGRHDAELRRAEEFAGAFPAGRACWPSCTTARETLERTVETLTDRLAHDPFLADSLHEVISAVTAIRSTSSILVDTEALEPEWQARFHRNINEDSARLTEGAQALVRYLEGAANRRGRGQSPQDEMHAFLAARGFHFPSWSAAGRRAMSIGAVGGRGGQALSTPRSSLAREVLERYLRMRGRCRSARFWPR